MITDGEKWHYTAVKRLSGLLRGVTGNNNGDFYCLNCFHEYTKSIYLKNVYLKNIKRNVKIMMIVM